MADSLADGIAADIEAWDAIGEHRTGTTGDRLTADWLRDSVRAAGVPPRRDDFPLSRWVLRRCAIEVDGTTIEGVPLFDGGTTGAEGVVGRLRPVADGRLMADGDGSPVIGLGGLGPDAGVAANRAFAAARREAAPAALVAVARINADVPGLALQNADHFRAPFGPPVLQVETGHEARLRAAAASGEEIRLTAEVGFEPALGWNVHARIGGRRPALAPFVVVTPKSSWWVSTAERGGGIAVWLALVRHFAANAPDRDVIFIATSGHELGALGPRTPPGDEPGTGCPRVAAPGRQFRRGGIRHPRSSLGRRRAGNHPLGAGQRRLRTRRHKPRRRPPGRRSPQHPRPGRAVPLHPGQQPLVPPPGRPLAQDGRSRQDTPHSRRPPRDSPPPGIRIVGKLGTHPTSRLNADITPMSS